MYFIQHSLKPLFLFSLWRTFASTKYPYTLGKIIKKHGTPCYLSKNNSVMLMSYVWFRAVECTCVNMHGLCVGKHMSECLSVGVSAGVKRTLLWKHTGVGTWPSRNLVSSFVLSLWHSYHLLYMAFCFTLQKGHGAFHIQSDPFCLYEVSSTIYNTLLNPFIFLSSITKFSFLF